MPVLFCFPFPGKWILFQLILGPKTVGEEGLRKNWEEFKVMFQDELSGGLPAK